MQTPESRAALFAEMLALASREETSIWCETIWDRQLEMDAASGALDKLWDAREMSPKEALAIGMESAQATASKLADLWIKREKTQRRRHPMNVQTEEPIVGTLESEATKQCRLDLQRAFAVPQV